MTLDELLDFELEVAGADLYRCPECGKTLPGSTWVCHHLRLSWPKKPGDYQRRFRPVKVES